MSKIPVIIDADPGIDDAIAIILLAGSEKAEIKAITTTHGNVGLEGTTKNALILKEMLSLDCPVAKGASKPMIVPQKEASVVHGKNGLGDYDAPRPEGTPCREAAWDVMYRLAKGSGGEMRIVAIGPLTNVALTVLKYPDFKNYIKRIYMMGGSRDYGNHSQMAEFNIWGDPHACQVVLNSGIPITMCDMGFGKLCALNGRQVEDIYSHANKIRPMLNAFMEHDRMWIKKEEKRLGRPLSYDDFEIAIYDSTAAAALLMDGDGLVTEDYFVICETQSDVNRGQTIFDYKNHYKDCRPNVQLAVDIDKDKYIRLMKSAFEKY